MVLRKGAWSMEEDRKLIAYINRYGIWNWRKMPGPAGLSRCGKSCRLRWMNYLNPQMRRGNFTREEDETIIKMHKAMGTKWSAMAAALPGRTDNEIKNHWHTHLRKRPSRPVTKQSQASSTTSDDNKASDLSEPDSPISLSSFGYGSPTDTTNSSTAASVETSETEEISEASSNMPLISENLFLANLQQAFDEESGFLRLFGECWDQESMSPLDSIFPPLPGDIDDGIPIGPIFQ